MRHAASLEGMMPNNNTTHQGLRQPVYKEIAEALKAGDVVPFLGAGASIACNLPSAAILAERLATEAEFPDANGRHNLALVASYLVQVHDSLKLARLLREVFDVKIEPGRLHNCLARIDDLRLIVTTNYDDLIERALEARHPWVVVDRGRSGNVWIRQADDPWREFEAKRLSEVVVDRSRPIIFKMHGSLDRGDKDNDAFLITEEQYVDLLGRPETGQIPPMLATMMKRKNFLFLGYGLKDWNVRVMLRKLALARNPADRIKSWAIVLNASDAEKKLWAAQNVEIYEVELDTFVEGLESAL